MSHNDTIVAQATPPGRGGVGILRISGLKARDVAQAVLGKLPKPRYADYLPFKDSDGSALAQGIALWFPSGLVVYYIVSNLVTIIQQQLIYRGLEKRGLHSREKKKS